MARAARSPNYEDENPGVAAHLITATQPGCSDPRTSQRWRSSYDGDTTTADDTRTSAHPRAENSVHIAPRVDMIIDGAGHERRPANGHEPHEQIELLNDRYQLLQNLGRGNSGQVLLAFDVRFQQHVAIKMIDRTKKQFDPKVACRELQNQLLCASHPNIVQLLEVFLTEQHLAVVMEYADGGDLAHSLEARMQATVTGISEPQARILFQQLMIAVQFCHCLGIANRDIKLDNMMLHRGCHLKMCDFGFSKDTIGQSTCKSSCGTPEYIAPEVLFQGKYSGQSADIWSCGVSLYVLLTGRFPFSWPSDVEPGATAGKRLHKMLRRVLAGAYVPLPVSVSGSCQDLIASMLKPKTDERATVTEIMSHPWFIIGLPRGAMSINENLIQRRATARSPDSTCESGPCFQTSDELAALVASCKAVPDLER